MDDLSFLKFPLRIVPHCESIEVRDAGGIVVAYVYYADDPARRLATSRPSKQAAIAIARITARALTQAAASGGEG